MNHESLNWPRQFSTEPRSIGASEQSSSDATPSSSAEPSASSRRDRRPPSKRGWRPRLAPDPTPTPRRPMGASQTPRMHRARGVRRSLPSMGHTTRPRGRAQAAAGGRRVDRARGVVHHPRRSPARTRPASQCRHHLRRRADRRSNWVMDGICPRAHARTDAEAGQATFTAIETARVGAEIVQGDLGGSRGRPAASRHQGAERDARRRRTRCPDGLRGRTSV